MDKREGEVSRLLSKISCLTLPKIFVGEPFSVSLISGIKNFMPMRGKSRFTIEKMLSHGPEKLRGGSLLCFTKFLVSKKFMDKRGGGGMEGGREYQDLLSKTFCLTVPKILVWNPSVLCFGKFPVANRFMDKKRDKYQDFLQRFFVSQCRKMP